jgi:DNA-binding NarL/FixJ family response regulator
VVADGHPIARRGVIQLLEETDDCVVVGEASSGEGALDLVATTADEPDVLVLDLRLPGIDGLETTQRFIALCPHAGVVILTAFDDARSMAGAVRAGARAYVLKTASGEEILETVRMVAHGHVVFGSSVWDALMHEPMERHGRDGQLTARESEVLALLARGLSRRDIAHELGVSAETVKTHLERLYRRLGVTDRTDAVATGLRSGIIE